MTTNKKLDWRPSRNGDIYCSSACGGKCTIDEFQKAYDQATELVRELGDGWFPRVWENSGWYGSAIVPFTDLMVMKTKDGYYSVTTGTMVSTHNLSLPEALRKISETFKREKETLEGMIKHLDNGIQNCRKTALEDEIGELIEE